MLIKINDSVGTGVQKYKNPFWVESPLTPNEAVKPGGWDYYSKFNASYTRYNKIPKKGAFHKFFEVRILKTETSVLSHISQRWWSHPNVMEKVIWVYQQPITEYADGQPYQYYAVEFQECQWINKLIGSPNHDMSACYIIPVECVDMAWNERVDGISEHLHYRPEVIKTQEEIDQEAELDSKASALLNDIIDIHTDARWLNRKRNG